MLTTPARSFAAEQRKPAITTASDRNDVSTDVRPIGERIKENTKTASYMGIIALGATVTGIMFFAICRELLSSSSPNSVYSDALDRCVNVSHWEQWTVYFAAKHTFFNYISYFLFLIFFSQDTRVQDTLGAPIKGFGEESRRGRRQHVAHSVFDRNGSKHIRMQFYVQGIRNKATVHVEKNVVSMINLMFER